MTGVSRDQLFTKHEDIRPITEMVDRILATGFLPKQETKNPVEIYSAYPQHLSDSLEGYAERVSIQQAYLEDLRTVLTKVGFQEESIRILYVLDVYRRVYGMTLAILGLLRVAILLSKGETEIEDASAEDIVSVLTENGYVPLVEAINPQIRYCESHLATRVSEGKRKVLLTKREGFRRIAIKEYSYYEIVSFLERLYNVVFPAIYYAFAKFDGFLKLLLLDSFEYQLLLISKIAA